MRSSENTKRRSHAQIRQCPSRDITSAQKGGEVYDSPEDCDYGDGLLTLLLTMAVHRGHAGGQRHLLSALIKRTSVHTGTLRVRFCLPLRGRRRLSTASYREARGVPE
ncbi:hypothetical protein H106_06683 [Trichophyton rubrum CBS 735.88]|nr:hypothetical protein H106_06683 [Trichophyton rubrum CBS 735.88]